MDSSGNENWFEETSSISLVGNQINDNVEPVDLAHDQGGTFGYCQVKLLRSRGSPILQRVSGLYGNHSPMSIVVRHIYR